MVMAGIRPVTGSWLTTMRAEEVSWLTTVPVRWKRRAPVSLSRCAHAALATRMTMRSPITDRTVLVLDQPLRVWLISGKRYFGLSFFVAVPVMM
jgi:hypothetical protein